LPDRFPGRRITCMPIGNHILFQCNHCGGHIPWQLNRADIGLSDREEPRHGKTYPYEKCVCGGGKFVRCVDRRSESLPAEAACINNDVKKKVDSARYEHLPLRVIHPNPKQPRRFFDKVALQSLADSLATLGLLEDILVRKDPKAEGFEIVMGERRWRAAQIAGLPVISCKIVELQDDEAKILSLVENLRAKSSHLHRNSSRLSIRAGSSSPSSAAKNSWSAESRTELFIFPQRLK
jgi:hypothetical protein